MTFHHALIHAVPTNIITGFLGSGKTSTILHLLKSKPADERWAILINEFGEIGVDASLVKGQYPEPLGVSIREVPGGCMCCVAGLPMQIALNQLLAKAKPDRLLIEPTGLGHPKEVLAVLTQQHYKEVLAVQKTLTLVDATKLNDPRYTSHEIFNQQIGLADVVVGNKADLYKTEDEDRLRAYVQQQGQPHVELLFATQGNIPLSVLEDCNKAPLLDEHHHKHEHHHHKHEVARAVEQPMPDCGYVKATNQGQGFKSIGWRFAANKIFARNKLHAFLLGLEVERMKATFITDKGMFGYNLSEGSLSEVVLSAGYESRIELIATELDDSIELKLLACILT